MSVFQAVNNATSHKPLATHCVSVAYRLIFIHRSVNLYRHGEIPLHAKDKAIFLFSRRPFLSLAEARLTTQTHDQAVVELRTIHYLSDGFA